MKHAHQYHGEHASLQFTAVCSYSAFVQLKTSLPGRRRLSWHAPSLAGMRWKYLLFVGDATSLYSMSKALNCFSVRNCCSAAQCVHHCVCVVRNILGAQHYSSRLRSTSIIKSLTPKCVVKLCAGLQVLSNSLSRAQRIQSEREHQVWSTAFRSQMSNALNSLDLDSV